MATLEAIFLSTGKLAAERRLDEWRGKVAGSRDLWPLVADVRYQAGHPWMVMPRDWMGALERTVRMEGLESMIGKGHEDEARLGTAGARLSRFFETTAICISMQSVVDAFAYYRFEKGREIRCLCYGLDGPEERTWETVRGTPEDWEERVIFRGDDLEEYLALHDESEVEAIRAQYLARRYDIGGLEPGIDARSVTGEILDEYGIAPEWPIRTSLRPSLPRRLWLSLGFS